MQSLITQVLVSQVSNQKPKTLRWLIAVNPGIRPLGEAPQHQAKSMSRLLSIAQAVGLLAVTVSAVIMFVGCSEPKPPEQLTIPPDPLRQAERLLGTGQYAEAVTAFEELRTPLTEPSVRHTRVLFGLGRAYFGRGGLREGRFAGPTLYREDQKAAHDALRKALEQAQAVACPDLLVGQIHSYLGNVLLQGGNFRGAAERFGDAERIFQESGREQYRGTALSNLILALVDGGDLSEVRARCAELRAMPGTMNDPNALAVLGAADLALGNLIAARTNFDMARIRADQNPDFRDDFKLRAELYINVAVYLQAIGSYDDAEEVLARILRQATEREADPRTTAMIRANLGRVFLTLERLDEAEEKLDDARTVLNDLLGNKHPATLYLVLDQAKLAGLRVDLVGAREHCEKAIAWGTAALGEDHPLVADARLALAKVLVEDNRCSEAMTQAEKATTLRDQIYGPNHVRSVKTCLEAMLLAAACQETEPGRVLLHKLRPLASRRFERLAKALDPDHLEILVMKAHFADVSALTPATYEQASARYLAAEKGFERVQGGEGLTLARLRFKQGKMLELRDRPDDALAKYTQALRSLDIGYEHHPVRAVLLAAKGDLLKSRNQLVEARDCFREAHRILERRYGKDHPKVKEFAAKHGGL